MRIFALALLALLLGMLVLLALPPDITTHEENAERILSEPGGGAAARDAAESGPVRDGALRVATPAAVDSKDAEAGPLAAPRYVLVEVVHGPGNAPIAAAQVGALDHAAYFRQLRAVGLHYRSEEGRQLRDRAMDYFATDQRGHARIPWQGAALILEARKGELWGSAYVPRYREGPVRLVLDRDEHLFVHVQRPDGSGAPVPGIGVSLRVRDRQSPEERYHAHDSYASEPGGVVVFEHVQRRFQHQEEGWFLTFAFPHVPELRVPVARPLPKEPIVLCAPPMGSFRLHVLDARGEPLRREGVHLRLAAAPANDPDRTLIAPIWDWREVPAGSALALAHVGLGLVVHAELLLAGQSLGELRFAGPTREGECVSAELRVTEDLPIQLFGRFVDDRGRPVRPGSVTAAALNGLQSELLHFFELDPEGSGFRLEYPFEDAQFDRLRFFVRLGDATLEALVPLPAPLERPRHGLGDVVLARGELLVAGRVQDTRGRPVAGASVYVEDEVAPEQWRRLRGPTWDQTDEQGEFACYARVDAGELPRQLRVFVRDRDDNTARQLSLRGERQLLVILRPTGRIEGSVRSLPGQRISDFMLVLLGGGQGRGVRLDAQGHFDIGGLEPDTYRLRVQLRGATGPRSHTEIAQLVVRAEETCADPRLRGITVGEGALVLGVHVVDATSGAPIAGAVFDWPGRPAALPMPTSSDGRAKLYFDELPASLRVRAAGFCSQTSTSLVREMRFELRPGLPLTVTLIGGLPELPQAARLGFAVHARRGERREHAIPGGSFVYFDSTGSAQCVLPGPGRYELELRVQVVDRAAGRSAPVDMDAVTVEAQGEMPLQRELQISTAALRAAIAAAEDLGPRSSGAGGGR